MTPEELKRIRKQRGLSAEAMAKYVGVSGRQYLNYESGKTPMPMLVEREYVRLFT